MLDKYYRDENGTLISKLPQTWEEIKTKIENDNLVFGRDVPTAKKYHERKCEIRSKWRSVDDYCKHTYLNYPARVLVSDGRKVRYVEECEEPREVQQLAENDFPYNLPPSICHYVLWSDVERDWSEYRNYVNDQFPSNHYDVIMYENSKQKKSVKSVVHVQVFVRKKA